MPAKVTKKEAEPTVVEPETVKVVTEKKKSKKEEPVPEPVKAVLEPVKAVPEKKKVKKEPVEEVKEVVEDVKEEEVKEEKKKPEKKIVTAKTKKAVVKGKKTPKKANKKKDKSNKNVVETELKLSEVKKPRYFKLIYNDEPIGRFSGNKPKQAANKALTSIIKDMEKNKKDVIGVDIRFSLKECTRWNKKKCRKGGDEKIEKIYNYLGKRELLNEEVEVDHIQNETDASILKAGTVLEEKTLPNGDVKTYLEIKAKDLEKHMKVTDDEKKANKGKKVIVKKITGKDKSVKYAIINEIKYKYTNKVQKFKTEQPEK